MDVQRNIWRPDDFDQLNRKREEYGNQNYTPVVRVLHHVPQESRVWPFRNSYEGICPDECPDRCTCHTCENVYRKMKALQRLQRCKSYMRLLPYYQPYPEVPRPQIFEMGRQRVVNQIRPSVIVRTPTPPPSEIEDIIDVTGDEEDRENSFTNVFPEQSPESKRCRYCGKGIPNASGQHEKRCLVKLEGKHRCVVCNKCYTQSHTLRQHMNSHTGLKPYECSVCNKSFADISTRNKHVRIHTGETPYACTLCPREFTQSGNMYRHMEKIHGKEETARYRSVAMLRKKKIK